jgi:hypothetical protein
LGLPPYLARGATNPARSDPRKFNAQVGISDKHGLDIDADLQGWIGVDGEMAPVVGIPIRNAAGCVLSIETSSCPSMPVRTLINGRFSRRGVCLTPSTPRSPLGSFGPR